MTEEFLASRMSAMRSARSSADVSAGLILVIALF